MSGFAVSAVSHRYGARQALKDVSFNLEPGTFCALLGQNGAGKSTLFALATRLTAIQSGSFSIAGFDVSSATLKALARTGIVFQQPTLDLDMTVAQNMAYFAALHGLRGADRATKIDAALDRLRMHDRKSEKVRALNGGHRRRMEIARALIHDPDVLLLDEPTVGLDAETRTAITDHVHDLTDSGMTVVWATHLVDEIRPSDQVIILHRGAVLRDCQAKDLTEHGTLEQTFLALTQNSRDTA